MEASTVSALANTVPPFLSARSSAFPSSSMTSMSAPALGAAKHPIPPSLPQLSPQSSGSPPRLSKTSPTPQYIKASSEDHLMASPPSKSPKLSEVVKSTAESPAATAGASPKPPTTTATATANTLSPPHSSSSTTPTMTIAAPGGHDSSAGGETPSQLAYLLAVAFSDADSLRRELDSTQKRASRAERLLASLQGVIPPSPENPAANVGTDAPKNGRSVRNGNEMPDYAVKAILDAEARAERAERARDDLAHLLHTLSVSFTELERYEASCALRAADARATFARTISSAAATHPPSGPPTLDGSSPRSDAFRDNFSLPALPAPMGMPALAPGSSTVHLTGPGAPPANVFVLALHTCTTPAGFPVLWQSSAHANTFHSLPLPPPPTATGLASLGSTLLSSAPPSAGATVPAKRAHRSRSGRGDEVNGDWEEQKRRRIGGWDMDLDSPVLSPPHGQVSSYAHAHAQQPLSAHPTHTSRSQASAPRGYERPSPLPAHHQQLPPQAPTFGSSARENYAQTNAQSIYMRDSGTLGAPGSSAGPVSTGKYDSRRYDEREGMGRDLGRVDARELVRDAKERERRGREYARDAYPSFNSAPRTSHHASRSRHTGAGNHVEGGRRRSRSRSTGSSSSIGEMLLETATDREGERRRDDSRPSPVGPHREPPLLSQYQTTVFATSASGPIPASSGHSPTSNTTSSQAQAIPKKPGSTHSHSSNGSNGNGNMIGVNGTANGVNGKAQVPSTQLVTLGPGGVVVSGGGPSATSAAASLPGGGFPAQNAQGQRICRQCGVPGRYKDGKCVEKWGPGPEGPGTVCDRCRKKMKRVERRGTLDSAAANSSIIVHRQSQAAPLSYSHSQPQAHPQASRARQTSRQDTILVDDHSYRDQSRQSTMLSPRVSHAYSRERESRAGSSRSHSPNLGYHPSTSTGGNATRHSPLHPSQLSQSQSYLENHSQNSHPSNSNGHRRAPTPPYINSISTREQYANTARPGVSAARSSRPRSRASSINEDDLLDGDGDGEEEAEDENDPDAEFVRAANGKNTGRPYPNGVSSGAAVNVARRMPLPSVATMETDSLYPRSHAHLHSLPHSHARHAHAHAQGQDELEDDAEGDVEGSRSRSRSGGSSADSVANGCADGSTGDGDGEGDPDEDAEAEIMDAVDATMKVED